MWRDQKNKTWQDNIFKLASHFVPKQITFNVKKFPQYCGRCHSRALVFLFSVGTRTYMYIDVASGRMTKARRR